MTYHLLTSALNALKASTAMSNWSEFLCLTNFCGGNTPVTNKNLATLLGKLSAPD
jgi:hypothetical protein